MSPGPSEEVGKVAIGVIEALRTQPALLILIIFNALFLLAVFWAVREQRHYQHELMTLMIEQQAKSTEMLSKCVVPRP